MFDNARNDNVYPIVASGYRTTEKQQSLMDEKISDYENEGYSADKAKEKAEAWVAIPGTSEHQLGLSVDINADGVHSTGNEVYEWLDKNAYKYGFIHRYPSDKTEITGVINEPWHYRYVGIEAAQEIKEQGVCLEEYLKQTNWKAKNEQKTNYTIISVVIANTEKTKINMLLHRYEIRSQPLFSTAKRNITALSDL